MQSDANTKFGYCIHLHFVLIFVCVCVGFYLFIFSLAFGLR